MKRWMAMGCAVMLGLGSWACSGSETADEEPLFEEPSEEDFAEQEAFMEDAEPEEGEERVEPEGEDEDTMDFEPEE